MKKKELDNYSNKIVKAFLKNKIIKPLPIYFTKKISNAQKFRKLCESKIKEPIIGFKAAGTAFAVIKKLGEKEPFYAAVYKRNFLKSGKKVKINNYTLGIELEVVYKIKKNFFSLNKIVTTKNLKKYIISIAPAIEIVGYRQRKKGIKSFGDLCSDFGANVKFIIGKQIKNKKIDIKNLKTSMLNKKFNKIIYGNTNTVYKNPLNSLKFVLTKLKRDKVLLNKDFYVFTGSSIGVVPLNNKGLFIGKIEKIGSVKTLIS
tara:strand:- start:25 stop:801 length:777 start_codon:yes stop_codon:yes gene_type:complete